MNQLQAFSALLGRLFLAMIFIQSGLSKMSDYAATQSYMDAMGVSSALLPLVIVLEVVGGIAIVIGFKARLVALAMAGFSLLSALLFHTNFSDETQTIMLMKNIAIAGGFLMIVAHGAGAYALDNRNAAQD